MMNDIILAAVLAVFVTWFIKTLYLLGKVVFTRSTELMYNKGDIEAVLEHCYNLFPIESLLYNGNTFKRGMEVRVITNRSKTIEGKFIGLNEENMVCFMTPNTVVAQELGNIEEMSEL